jgi:hypothetical protein
MSSLIIGKGISSFINRQGSFKPGKIQMSETNFDRSFMVLLDVIKISIIAVDLGWLRNILHTPLIGETRSHFISSSEESGC